MSSSVAESIESQSSLSETPPPPPTPLPRPLYRRIKRVTYIHTGRPPALHRGQILSTIWNHGDTYIDENEDNLNRVPMWICDHCDQTVVAHGGGTTGNALRHLKRKHRITSRRARDEQEEAIPEEIVVEQRSSTHLHALVVSINVDRFRMLFLRLFINCQLPYSLVERPEFQELILYIQPSIGGYLVKSHNTVTTWVNDEFNLGKNSLKRTIAQAASNIHLSFDMWTSPSSMPILGVCAHFLTPQLELVHPLLALREVEGSHTGEAMAEIIREIMVQFGIVDKWGVCVADNADNCNTCCRALVRQLRPGEPTKGRRSRCLGHMVNLAAKAFIYGKQFESFIAEAEEVVVLTARDQAAAAREMSHWRERGPFGKLHNVIKHIRVSPQRRQRFNTYVSVIAERDRPNGGEERDRQDGQVLEEVGGDEEGGEAAGAVLSHALAAVA